MQVEHFRTSERAQACTTLVRSQEFLSQGQKYLVVDTPGFDETDEADKKHVKELLEVSLPAATSMHYEEQCACM